MVKKKTLYYLRKLDTKSEILVKGVDTETELINKIGTEDFNRHTSPLR